MANYPWNMRKLLDPASDKEDTNYTAEISIDVDEPRGEPEPKPAATSNTGLDKYGQLPAGPQIEPTLKISDPIPAEAQGDADWEWLFNVGDEHMCIARRNTVTGALATYRAVVVKTYAAGEMPELVNSLEDRRQFMQQLMDVAWQCGFRPEVEGWDANQVAFDKEIGELKKQNGQLAAKLVEAFTELSKAREAHLQDMRIIAMSGRRLPPAESIADIAPGLKPEAATARRS